MSEKRNDARNVRAGRRTVRVSRPEKVLFPDDGITKWDLVEYYRSVSRRIIPQLRGRPLMMERHPDGIGGKPLMQKNAPDHFPDWVRRAVLPKEGGKVTHVVCDDTATLLYLADQACVTPHRWLSRADRPDHPDRLILDLDPPSSDESRKPNEPGASGASGESAESGFEEVRWAARRCCALLGELGLPGLLMTTGSRGLHVVVPLDGHADFDTVRSFARDAADLLAARHPDRLTTEPRKAKRRGRLYLDTQRNAYAQTAVTPYAVRARPGAPVATPIDARELDDPALRSDRWTLRTVGERLADDPWARTDTRGRSLRAPRERLRRLAEDEGQG
ncbi:DNA polymerase domain-containing protein [Streptomyces sp. S465]|uniref:DNA polymerase domain-containing protein n=1 Tax=Streptomyces sp. S465 TaxID=2979468 RepID=UPI0022A8C425|nr:DNA primase small subunit domain-containing protein [Streptomyces sp. S465]WAP57211.1 ATP-dependent DNA ligase [Streptomyces sp. S465]